LNNDAETITHKSDYKPAQQTLKVAKDYFILFLNYTEAISRFRLKCFQSLNS